MKLGLVIGKFMPVHNGHLALIDFATRQCDELIVSMNYTDEDPIPHALRFSWLTEILEKQVKIKPGLVRDDFDDPSLAWPGRTKKWAAFITSRYGKIDVIISSEEYGPQVAEHLGAHHVSFDRGKTQVPVSASLIRQKPLVYWEYIPPVVQPYFVKMICFYGPESTGKSVMAKHLAACYQTEYVPEVAREIVSSNDFTIDDIIKTGHSQTERVLEKIKTANRILFCDTDLITTQIYCRQYLGVVPDILVELEKKIAYDQYYLFDIDVPWVADGMRDLGERREELFAIFRDELKRRNISYKLVSGTYEASEAFLRSEIDALLN